MDFFFCKLDITEHELSGKLLNFLPTCGKALLQDFSVNVSMEELNLYDIKVQKRLNPSGYLRMKLLNF